MGPLGHRRQVLLFLIAILAPSILVLALALRMAAQDRELAEKRRYDERMRFVAQVRDALVARLDEVRREAPGSAGSPVALVAAIDRGNLVLPWESADPGRDLLSVPEFAARVRAGAQQEFGGAALTAALGTYEDAVRLAKTPAQAAYARLLRARALDRVGRQADAAAEFRRLLRVSPQLTDEEGIPIRMSAAERLMGEDPEAARVIASEAERAATLPPAACYLLLRILEKRNGSVPVAGVAERIRDLEAAAALQKDFPRLRLAAGVWLPYGEEPWMIARVEDRLVAVRSRGVFAWLEERWRDRRLSIGLAQGEPLGDRFPDLKASFAAANDTIWTSRAPAERYLFWSAFALVIGATTFGASLLWHDLRREVRMAEMRSQFVSSVSHELKTPLTAIRMFAETLQMRRSQDPRAEEEYLDTIVSECERLSRLVDNVLQFSRLERGKKIYRFQPTALAGVVEAAARAMQYPLSQQGFELRVQADDDLPLVRADGDALQQAVLNLLSNAMKYSGDSHTIELDLRRANGYAVIRVTDYGIGIASEEQTHIFEKYYRSTSRENQLIPGTGLGLALVSHAAKAHGGRVEVRSAPGQGSTFSIILPLTETTT